ncbi:signal recognition particle 54 kda protein 3, partial [Quercus suber]
MNAQNMSKVLPPQMLKQIGGMGGLQNLMKQMGSTKDMMGMFGGGDKMGGFSAEFGWCSDDSLLKVHAWVFSEEFAQLIGSD